MTEEEESRQLIAEWEKECLFNAILDRPLHHRARTALLNRIMDAFKVKNGAFRKLQTEAGELYVRLKRQPETTLCPKRTKKRSKPKKKGS